MRGTIGHCNWMGFCQTRKLLLNITRQNVPWVSNSQQKFYGLCGLRFKLTRKKKKLYMTYSTHVKCFYYLIIFAVLKEYSDTKEAQNTQFFILTIDRFICHYRFISFAIHTFLIGNQSQLTNREKSLFYIHFTVLNQQFRLKCSIGMFWSYF